MTSIASDLMPCPFTHEVRRGVFLEVDTDDFGFVRGACSDCWCAGPLVTLADLEKATDAEKAEATKLWNDRKALSQLTREVDELRARIAATQAVIESGYRGVNKTDQCSHGLFGFEDCIACYDEALFAALNGEALSRSSGGGQ